MSEINNLIDKISILFSEFILGIVIIDDKEFVVLMLSAILAIISIILLFIIYNFNKNNPKIRLKTLKIGSLICYDFCVVVLSLLFKWWFAILLIICCSIILRKTENQCIDIEINLQNKQKLTEDICIKNSNNNVLTVLLNIFSSFIVVQLIMCIF